MSEDSSISTINEDLEKEFQLPSLFTTIQGRYKLNPIFYVLQNKNLNLSFKKGLEHQIEQCIIKHVNSLKEEEHSEVVESLHQVIISSTFHKLREKQIDVNYTVIYDISVYQFIYEEGYIKYTLGSGIDNITTLNRVGNDNQNERSSLEFDNNKALWVYSITEENGQKEVKVYFSPLITPEDYFEDVWKIMKMLKNKNINLDDNTILSYENYRNYFDEEKFSESYAVFNNLLNVPGPYAVNGDLIQVEDIKEEFSIVVSKTFVNDRCLYFNYESSNKKQHQCNHRRKCFAEMCLRHQIKYNSWLDSLIKDMIYSETGFLSHNNIIINNKSYFVNQQYQFVMNYISGFTFCFGVFEKNSIKPQLTKPQLLILKNRNIVISSNVKIV
jgi:hypothetical protein